MMLVFPKLETLRCRELPRLLKFVTQYVKSSHFDLQYVAKSKRLLQMLIEQVNHEPTYARLDKVFS